MIGEERMQGRGRFRCVIYLCGAPHTDITEPRTACTEHAEAFGWEITDVIEERTGLLPPHGRAGLGQAVEHIKSGAAGAVLTAWRSMISPVPQEYDEVAREIEKAGGFLHVKASVRKTIGPVPWALRRMAPLSNASPTPVRYAGIDPATQTGRWVGGDGAMTPAELGKHGTSVNTYPPTQVGKDGKVDADSGHDATQD